MKRYVCALFVAVALLLPISALAQCPVQETEVLYLNGVDTTEKSARESKRRLEEEVSKIPSVLTECVS